MLGRIFSFIPSLSGVFSGFGGYAAVGLLAGVAAFGAAWQYQGERYGHQISEIRLAYEQASSEGLRRQAVQRAQQDLVRQDIDTQKTRELKDARERNETLARAVAAGEQRLRVAADCRPAGGDRTAAGAAGLDDAAAPELAAAARQDYFALRAEIAERDIQREALIDYVEMLTRQTTKVPAR